MSTKTRERLSSKNKPSTYVHSAIALLFMLCFQFIPAPDPITPLGMKVAGIFIGMVYAWVTVDLIWPSILGMLLLGMSGFASVSDTLKAGLGNDNVLLTFFMMLITGLLTLSGASRYVAQRLVSVKFARKRPYVLTIMIFVASAVLGSMMNGPAAMLVLWSILYGICDIFGFKKGDKWPMLVAIGICLTINIFNQIFPFKVLPAAMLGAYGEITNGAGINFMSYFIWMLITDSVVVGLYLLYMKFIARPDVSLITNADLDKELVEREEITPYQKFVLWFVLVLIVFLLVPSILPKSWMFTKILTGFGNTGLCALGVTFLVFLNLKQGISLKAMIDTVSWNVIFVMAAAMALTNAIKSDSVGIQAYLAQISQPLFAGKSPFVFACLMVVIVLIITQFCNNLATGTVFTPIAYTLAVSCGMENISALIAMMITAAAMALMTPAGGGMPALMHSNREWIPGKNAVKYSTICVLFVLITLIAIGIPLANLLF